VRQRIERQRASERGVPDARRQLEALGDRGLDAPHRVADDHRALDREPVEERDDVRSEVVGMVAAQGAARVAVPALRARERAHRRRQGRQHELERSPRVGGSSAPGAFDSVPFWTIIPPDSFRLLSLIPAPDR
jgi:hypothetical protein